MILYVGQYPTKLEYYVYVGHCPTRLELMDTLRRTMSHKIMVLYVGYHPTKLELNHLSYVSCMWVLLSARPDRSTYYLGWTETSVSYCTPGILSGLGKKSSP